MAYEKYPRLIALRITDEQFKYLKKESKRDKTDLSQLVRWALDARYKL